MPEYDAFGREIGEDSLASWRTGASAEPAPAPPDPAPAPAAVTAGDPLGTGAASMSAGATASAASPPAGTPPRPSGPPAWVTDRSPARRRFRYPARLLVIGVLAVAFLRVAGEVKDAVRGIDIEVPAVTQRPTAPEPTGLGARSLLRPAAFERALADLRGREIGRLQSLRLAPERIDASLLTPRGTLVSVQLRPGAELRRFSESGDGFGGLDTIPYAKLDPRAPQRLVRAAAERLGRPVSRIDYLVPTLTSGELTWGAYFKGGAIFLANARGKITRRIS